MWTLWHDEKPSTLTIRLLQRTKSPQKRIAGAENSGSENTSPTVEKALMLKSPPVKSRCTASCSHVTVVEDQWKRHVSWPQHCGCAQSKNVTVGVPEREGRRSSPRTMSSTMPHVPLLVESSLKAKTTGSGSKVSLLSKMARSVLPVYAMN